MEFVKIRHPNIEAEGECALSALPIWEGLGWHRVEASPIVVDLAEAAEAPVQPPAPKASRRATNEE